MPKISEAQKNERKQIILDAALAVFGEKGYSEASMDDIVRASGISKGGIYTYFHSKESILLEIAEQRFKARNQLVDSLKAEESVVSQLEKYMRWLLESLKYPEIIRNARFTFEFWAVLSRNPGSSDLSVERYRRFEADLKAVFERGIATGELRPDLNISSAVLHLLSGLDGIGFMSTVMNVPISEQDIDEFIQLYLNYWRNPK